MLPLQIALIQKNTKIKKKKPKNKEKGALVSGSCWDMLFPGRQEEKLTARLSRGAAISRIWQAMSPALLSSSAIYPHSLAVR